TGSRRRAGSLAPAGSRRCSTEESGGEGLALACWRFRAEAIVFSPVWHEASARNQFRGVKLCCPEHCPGQREDQFTASRRPLPGLKPGRRAAAICRVAPVCGLRPSRAARSLTAKVPKPTRETLSPSRRAAVMVSVRASSARAAVDFGRSAEAAMASISSALFMGDSSEKGGQYTQARIDKDATCSTRPGSLCSRGRRASGLRYPARLMVMPTGVGVGEIGTLMARSWDVFCVVVDNFGDVGVTWRLARQLAGEHGQRVRLWIDDLAAFARLCPEADPRARRQWREGVEIRRW